MKRLFAVLVGALFALTALAAPDASKVQGGAYPLTVAADYSMPSVSPPVADTRETAVSTAYTLNPTFSLGAGLGTHSARTATIASVGGALVGVERSVHEFTYI